MQLLASKSMHEYLYELHKKKFNTSHKINACKYMLACKRLSLLVRLTGITLECIINLYYIILYL